MRQSVETRIVRRTDRGGHSTGEHLLAAMRTIYTHAVRDELLPVQQGDEEQRHPREGGGFGEQSTQVQPDSAGDEEDRDEKAAA